MPKTPLEAWAFGARQFLHSWPLSLTTKPSTSKLSDNPALCIYFSRYPPNGELARRLSPE